MHAVGFLPPGGGVRAIDEHARTSGAATLVDLLQDLVQRACVRAVRPLRLAKLHQLHAARQCRVQTAQERGHARARAHRTDAVGGGQLQPAQRGQGGGQEIADGRCVGRVHPFQALVFKPLRLAFPRGHVAERQAHRGVRIHVHIGHPRPRLCHADAQLFLQFAGQRFQHGFTRLQLAARQFPPARPRLAFGPLAQQQHAVGAQDQTGGNVNDLLRHGGPPNRARIDKPLGPNASRVRWSIAAPRCARARYAPRGNPARAASGRRCPGSRPA
ncbi:hypothetical protein D3C87_1416830 [compost metagenome]